MFSIGSGTGAYLAGQLVARGDLTIPISTLQTTAVAGFLTLLWMALQRASSVNERLNTGHLLTTVSAPEAALGLLLTVYRRVAFPVSLPAFTIAVGLVTQTPVTAITTGIAVVGFVTLAALLGIVISLATSWSPRLRRYKNYTYLLAFILGLHIWIIILEGPVSGQAAIEWLQVVPIAWFVDFALLGLTDALVGQARGFGALGVTVVGLPVLTGATNVFAERVLTADRVGDSAIHRSRSLIGAGLAERLFAGWVSRPVLSASG